MPGVKVFAQKMESTEAKGSIPREIFQREKVKTFSTTVYQAGKARSTERQAINYMVDNFWHPWLSRRILDRTYSSGAAHCNHLRGCHHKLLRLT